MTSNRTRSNIKSTAPTGWKDKLRDECFQRLDAARSTLLQAARQNRTSGQDPSVQNALRTIISDSTDHLAAKSPPRGQNSSQIAAGDLPVPTPTSLPVDNRSPTDAQRPILDLDFDDSFNNDDRNLRNNLEGPPELSHLSPEEYEELMASLEAALYEDLLREEADYLDSLDRQDVDAMVEAHFGAMSLGGDEENGEEERVPCPICQESYLVQRQGVILCPQRHLRLDGAIEGLSLADLRGKLAAVLEEHARERCAGQPSFQQTGSTGTNSLMMKCDVCGALEIVM